MKLGVGRLQVKQSVRLWFASMGALLFFRLGLRSPSAWLSSISSCSQGSASGRLRANRPAVAARETVVKSASRSPRQLPSITPALVAGGSAVAAGCQRRRRSDGWSWSSRRAAGADDGDAIRLGKDSSPSPAPSSKASGGTKGGGQDKGLFGNMMEKWNKDPEFQEDVKRFFTSLTVALAIRFTLVEPRFIPSLSMYPNFDVGDQLTVDKISKNWRDYQRKDVVVFNPPPAFYQYTGSDRAGEALIKRIVALAGDTVEIKKGGTLFVNGEAQEEPFTNEAAAYKFGPVKVPEGCVLVLGDNRNQSLDGHIWGFLPVENIIGRATFKFWPPWHVGTVPFAPP
eukprot:TRINITY_DN27542_c0_g1_i1.p1 TRINITY_DN27542_c0_g1~~TRINITY_DN27542_c0_g1_i1.p1  ORF type:complete len:341 (+),score=53.93 TRINITY_DN27542_c0_g1_i1:109-1131(+)